MAVAVMTFPVMVLTVGFAVVNGVLNRLPGNDLALFFKMGVSLTEFFQGTIVECFLIILHKTLPIILC